MSVRSPESMPALPGRTGAGAERSRGLLRRLLMPDMLGGLLRRLLMLRMILRGERRTSEQTQRGSDKKHGRSFHS